MLSGGVFRRRDPWGGLAAVSSTLRTDPELAPALADVPVVIDTDFAVAPAGLLAANGRAEAAESSCATTCWAEPPPCRMSPSALNAGVTLLHGPPGYPEAEPGSRGAATDEWSATLDLMA